MKTKDNPTASSMLKKDDLIVIAGAGGFIAGSLARYFHDQGFTRIRAIDKKPPERPARVRSKSITSPRIWEVWALSNASVSSACAVS